MNTRMHPTEALRDLVDGRVTALPREALEAHLSECADCRREFEMLSALKRAAVNLPRVELPQELADRIAASLTQADGTAAHQRIDHATRRWSRWVVPMGLAAALLVAVWVWSRPTSSPPQSASDTAAQYVAGRLAMTSTESDARALGAFFAERVSFPVRVFDLGMMGYTLAGGRVHALAGNTSALWVYKSADGSMICQMYPGSVQALPPPAETRVNNDITFAIYHVGGGTQVFWQEGDIVCVLASDLPAEQVVQLAIAKAMKP